MSTIVTLISYFYAAQGFALRSCGDNLFVSVSADAMPSWAFYPATNLVVRSRDQAEAYEDLIGHFRQLVLNASTAQHDSVWDAIYNDGKLGLDDELIQAWWNLQSTHKYDLPSALDTIIELAVSHRVAMAA